MVQDDPTKRPTIDEVVQQWEGIRKGLSSWKLRSRVVDKDEFAAVGLFRSISHTFKRIRDAVSGLSAIPTP